MICRLEVCDEPAFRDRGESSSSNWSFGCDISTNIFFNSMILLLQALDKLLILFLSMSDRDTKLEVPSWVRRRSESSELSFMLLEDFDRPLSSWVVTMIVKNRVKGFDEIEAIKLSASLKCKPKFHETEPTIMIWATRHQLFGPFQRLRQLNGHIQVSLRLLIKHAKTWAWEC